MILHSKITPKRPQIIPDHIRSSQEHAFGTYFLTWPRQNSFSSRSPSPPQTEGTPLTSNGLSVAAFRFKSEKKTHQWSQLDKIMVAQLSLKGNVSLSLIGQEVFPEKNTLSSVKINLGRGVPSQLFNLKKVTESIWPPPICAMSKRNGVFFLGGLPLALL